MRIYAEIRIAGLYVILGFLWILFSDQAVLLFTRDPYLMNTLSTYKGWCYVGITGILLYFLVRFDRIKRDKYNNELRIAKNKAEEADRLKTRFLKNISHELRTPMNAIIGFTEILDDETITEENRHKYSAIITQKTNDLLSLVSNLIDIARIQEGQVTIKATKVYPHQLCQRAKIQAFTLGHFYGNNVELCYNEKQELSNIEMFTDGFWLDQVLTNLLHNAIKFTKKGTVEFGYQLKGNDVLFYVKDEGIGIAPEFHSQIFNSFSRGNEKDSNEYSGVGLGLPISKALVELLGGKIWLESEKGKGTVFYFTIPLTYSK